MKIPYRVVEHVPSGRGAAYSSRYAEMLVEEVSADLMLFAREHHVLKKPFKVDSGLPLPAWLTTEMLGDCVLYWLRNGTQSDEHILSTPRH